MPVPFGFSYGYAILPKAKTAKTASIKGCSAGRYDVLKINDTKKNDIERNIRFITEQKRKDLCLEYCLFSW